MADRTLTVTTSSKMEFVDITDALARELAGADINHGAVLVYNPHTTAGLTINEGADPAVQSDLIGVLDQLVPRNYPYRHLEGNSPAHLMASLIGSSVTVIVESGRPRLGTWQRIFFCEFDGPRSRKVWWRPL
ncbi:MAG: secondary thiamine-phosphate synthase enzyme YjbQ [Desulfobacterales bacterium]|nr:secondary thiamine-phosphate synthase enzyme YjbQ [Desulfobacterales bacterium]